MVRNGNGLRSILLSLLPVLALMFPGDSRSDNEILGCRDYGEVWLSQGAINLDFYYGRCGTKLGHTLYAAGDQYPGISIVNVASAETPVLTSQLELGGVVTGLAARSGDLLATVEDLGLVRLDLSDPWNPVPMDTLVLGSQHLDVVLDGDLAYVALGGGGVRAVTLAYPGLTIPMGQLSVGGAAKALALDGGYLYAAVNGVGLMVINIDDPTTLQAMSTQEFATFPQSIDARDGRVALAGRPQGQQPWHVWIYDVSDPYQPSSIATRNGSDQVLRALEVALVDSERVLVGLPGSLVEYTINAPFLQEAGVAHISASDILVTEDQIYAVGYSDLRVGTLGHLPPAPWAVLQGSGGRFSLRDGDVIYAANHFGLQVNDVTDPRAPVRSERFNLINNYISPPLAKEASVVYTTIPDVGLELVDVSNPMAPFSLGAVTLGREPWGLLAEGGYLYAANGADGLLVLDLSNPLTPTIVGEWPASSDPGHHYAKMALRGSELLVSNLLGGIDVFDVSDPTQPVLSDHLVVTGTIRDLDMMGDVLLVSGHYYPMSFWQRGEEGWEYLAAGPASVRCCAVGGDVFYCDVSSYQVEIYRLMDGQPQLVGIQPNASAQEFLLAGDDWLAAGGASNIILVPGQCSAWTNAVPELGPAARHLMAPVPNPFNPRTELSFQLEVEAEVELTLYDLAGRKVKTLWSGMAPGGTTTVFWDGKDDADRACASAVYLARFTSGYLHEVRKLALLR